MAKKTSSQQALPRKVYRMSKGQQLRSLLLAAMAALFGIATPSIIVMPDTQAIMKTTTTLVIVLICAFTAFIIVYAVYSTRLILTPEGLEYQGGFVRFYTPWKNIKCVRRIWRRPAMTEVLVLRKPATWSSRRIPGARWFIEHYKYDRSIPLTVFASQFSGSELEKDIRQHAPYIE